MDQERPVLVVGAGPTGLTAAMELARLGVRVRIVDQAPAPSTTSKALAIQARTLELLRPRGVGDEMLRRGQRASGTAIYGRGRKLATVELDRVPGRFNHILLLPQSETEELLARQVQAYGVDVERGVELLSFDHDAHGVRAVLKDRDGGHETVHAAYLIGADGAHSGVRHGLGLPFKGRALAQRYLLADLHIDGDVPADELSIFLARDGFVAVFPMAGGRFRFIATDPGPGADDDVPDLAALQDIWDHVTPLPARLRDPLWRSRFRINSRHVPALRAGRVFLGGDAAHVHSPAGGQGMNTGIQDMINLAWKLAMVQRGLATPALLDTYQADRVPVITKLVRATETATKVWNSTNPVVHRLVTTMAPLALGRDFVQDKATAVLGETTANYRKSPIAARAGRLGTLRAGDRVPDVDVVIDGETRRLHDLLDLTKLTVLSTRSGVDVLLPWHRVFTRHHGRIATAQPGLLGGDTRIAADLAAKPGVLVIRPDGYLAAAGTDPASLVSWFGQWFPVNGEGR
ncbi:FAD-dependent oxidoreductase [Amycolatopsis sp. NPDC049252]|uniref:FAD-dependent oxidoreductase n=1 Tax=Amycolatopsis sp. NPDC049252 TaxID=3363933 RepID=UPI00371C091D